MLTARVSPMPAPEPRGPAEALKAKEAGALLALGEPAGGLFSHSRPRACSRRSSGALSHSSLFSEAVLVCNLASALRAAESNAYQVWHLLCLVVAVFGVDASVLLRLPDQGRAAEGLDGALVVVLATFSGDWLVRASQRVSAGEQSPGFWRTAACYTDALSTATVVADLSWLRAGSSPALLRAARAARLVRFSRLARHTHAALFWLARGGKALDDAALDAAPSAIAAALCEEVAHKLAVVLIIAYICATPLLTYVENNSAALAWHSSFVAASGQPLPQAVPILQALAASCAASFLGAASQPLSISVPAVAWSWRAPTGADSQPVRTEDRLSITGSGVTFLLDVSRTNCYVAKTNVLIACALVGALLLVSAALSHSAHQHVVAPLRNIFELIQASAAAALEVLRMEGGRRDDGDGGAAMQGVESAVVRLATLVSHMSGVGGGSEAYVGDENMDEHTRAWLESQARENGRHASALSSAPNSPQPRPRINSLLWPSAPEGVRGTAGAPSIGYALPAGEPEIPLSLLDSWEFDSLELSTGQLFAAVVKMFDATGLFAARLTTPQQLWSFMGALEARYCKETPYHTFAHAVDVTHTLYRILKLTDRRTRLAATDKFALLVAALAHDCEHFGFNNSFLIATRHPWALTYSDSAPLEHRHIAALYDICTVDGQADIFGCLEEGVWRTARRTVVAAVLHTDMALHGGLISRAELYLQLHGDAGAVEGFPEECASDLADGDQPGGAAASGASVAFASPDERTLLFSLLLHAADISNPAKPQHIAVKWADRVLTEFFTQGDSERALNLPVAPMNDRHIATSRAAGQINFMEFVVAPLFAVLARALPELTPLLAQLLRNRGTLAGEYAAEASAAKAAGGDASAWDVGRMRNRHRAFREKYEPLTGPVMVACPVEDAASCPGGAGCGDGPSYERSASGRSLPSHAPGDAASTLASKLRAVRSFQGKPPSGASALGAHLASLSRHSSRQSSATSRSPSPRKQNRGGGGAGGTQWLRRSSGAVRHLFSEAPLLHADPGTTSPSRDSDGDGDGRPRLSPACGGKRHSSFANDLEAQSDTQQQSRRSLSSGRRGSFPPTEPMTRNKH